MNYTAIVGPVFAKLTIRLRRQWSLLVKVKEIQLPVGGVVKTVYVSDERLEYSKAFKAASSWIQQQVLLDCTLCRKFVYLIQENQIYRAQMGPSEQRYKHTAQRCCRQVIFSDPKSRGRLGEALRINSTRRSWVNQLKAFV